MKAFSGIGTYSWNRIPSHLTTLTKNYFKRKLKEIFFDLLLNWRFLYRRNDNSIKNRKSPHGLTVTYFDKIYFHIYFFFGETLSKQKRLRDPPLEK